MNTINKLNLQDESTVNELWSLQHKAYRLEAELIGFREIPPLMETREMLSSSKEGFYGCFDKDEELMGAVAVEEESPKIDDYTNDGGAGLFRRGIASHLLEYVFEHFAGMEQFIVSTGKKNTPAVSLYSKHGFLPTGVEEVAPGVELIEFHRSGSL